MSESAVPNTGTDKATLTCTQILAPPARAFGEASNVLNYATGSTCWQCTFSSDGQYLAACFGSPDLCIRVWKRVPASGENQEDTWQLMNTISGIHERTIRAISFAPVVSPLILASASFDGSICIWEYADTLQDWECAAQLEGHDNEVKTVAWNATGSLLASCSRDKSVWIWECFLPGTVGGPNDGGDFECIAVLNGHQADVKDVVFAPSHGQWGDGDEILLSASYDDTIKCWAEDAGDWYLAASLPSVHSSTIWALTISPGGGRAVSCSDDGSLGILKCYTNAEKQKLFPEEDSGSNGLWRCVGKLPNAHKMPIYSVDYAPARAGHGRIVSAGGDNRIQVYREAHGSSSDHPLFSLDVAVATTQEDINCVRWHPHNGSVLASAGDDGTVRLWKYKTGP